MIAKLSLVLGVLAAGATSASIAPHVPIKSAGDSVTLNYAYIGHVSPDGAATRLNGTLAISEPHDRSATVSIRHNGTLNVIGADVHDNGELTATARKSDLLVLYNAIPKIVSTQGDRNVWRASVPVKVSQTEWKDVPVTVTSTASGNHIDLDVHGRYSNIVIDHGFTVGEDVAVKGRLAFDNGGFVNAHFDVHEVVHTYTDIPIAYEWTMSR